MKSKLVFGCSLAAALLCTGPVRGQDPHEEEARLRQQLRDTRQELALERASGLRDIKVNGRAIAPEEVRREAIFLVGAKLVEAKISDFFAEEWKERAIEEGQAAEDFEITDEEVMQKLGAQVREFREKNPGVEFWEAVRVLTGLTKEGFMRQQHNTELFKKVFFPGPASRWPSITRDAIIAASQDGGGKQFWETIAKSTTDPATGKARPVQPLLMHMCRMWVVQQLKQWSDIRFPADGLPPDVVLSVNGRVWKTDEAFELVRAGVYHQDIERALSEVVIREALKQELQKTGDYMADDEFRSAFDEYRKQYDDTIFNTAVIATTFSGYPSLEAFRQRWRLMRSFEARIDKDINDGRLAEHAKRNALFFNSGQTDVHVIQFLAKSIKTGAWEPNGFAEAKGRAEEAFAAIENGAAFDDVLAERGEFYKTDEAKGRLGWKQLNQIRQHLHESEFTDLLMGYSIGNHLFYKAEPGKIMGPLRGPAGYYIARVNARQPTRGETSLEDPQTREMVKEDYVKHRFLAWSNDVLARTVVE